MKRWMLATVVMTALVVGPGVVVAHEGGAPHDEMAEMEEHGGSVQQVTGEVIDLACYLGEGERGPSHKECGEKCIASGLPVGIKTADALYLVISSDHTPANKTLAALTAQQVVAEGEVTERDGIRLLALKKVTVKE